MNKKYTAAELAFIKRRRTMPRREMLVAFKRKFRRRGFSLSRLQDLCNRFGWKVGSRKGRFKGRSRTFSKAELAFIKRRRRMSRRDLHAAFVEKFGRRDISCNGIRQLCTRRGWRTNPNWRRIRTKGRSKFSKAELAFLRRRQTTPRRELYAAYVETFGREISLKAFKQLCKRFGLRTGRTGCFQKGIVPANKGKKMPYNANSARTQFKKGQQPRNAKYAGHEYIDKDGYVLVSVNERNPHTGFERRYVAKHRWLWEKEHGPIPSDMVLKCLGKKSDPDPTNWEPATRGTVAARNSRFRGVKVPPELEAVAMSVTKLARQLAERRRKAAA